MKNIILLSFLTFTLFSCDIRYDGDTKWVTKGTVLSYDGTPIPDKEIKLYVTQDKGYGPWGGSGGDETNFIGHSHTDAEGNYTMVIPKPENYDEIIIEINDLNNHLSPAAITNINNSNYYNGYEFNAPEVKLIEKEIATELTLYIEDNTYDYNYIDSVDFIGNAVASEIIVNPPEELITYYYNIVFAEKNQELIIQCTMKNIDSGEETIHEETITIGNEDTQEHTIEI